MSFSNSRVYNILEDGNLKEEIHRKKKKLEKSTSHTKGMTWSGLLLGGFSVMFYYAMVGVKGSQGIVPFHNEKFDKIHALQYNFSMSYSSIRSCDKAVETANAFYGPEMGCNMHPYGDLCRLIKCNTLLLEQPCSDLMTKINHQRCEIPPIVTLSMLSVSGIGGVSSLVYLLTLACKRLCGHGKATDRVDTLPKKDVDDYFNYYKQCNMESPLCEREEFGKKQIKEVLSLFGKALSAMDAQQNDEEKIVLSINSLSQPAEKKFSYRCCPRVTVFGSSGSTDVAKPSTELVVSRRGYGSVG